MQMEKYTVTQYSISAILGFIEGGDIAIPEIQRPFVWKRKQVRDLIDSLYNGYPAGYLIIWQNPNVKLKDGRDSNGKKILIDGQQRVTALLAAILGQQVIDADYKETQIKIAFNPLAEGEEELFAVQDSSHLKSKKWVPDISILFKNDFSSRKFINKYLEDNNEVDEDKLDGAITQLKSIANRQIGVVELAHQLDIDEVTEIFIRINSQGKALSQSDFAMSKIAADEKYGGNMLRKAIDYFCHLSVEPGFYNYISTKDTEFMNSEFAHKLKWLKDDKESIYDPDYNDMLRVSFMHTFGRGKLGDLVSLLSGRNFTTRAFEEEIAESSFTTLKDGVLNFMNQYNFNSFILAIKSAGFISEKLINSQMTLDFAYTLYLILSASNEIPKNDVKHYVQKWYVLATLTSRYITSPESVMDRDIRNINAKGFLQFFKETEEAVLSDTFWNIGLVQSLETSAINSPYFNVFLAAQVHAGERALFSSTTKVADLISIAGDVHHIFPREYLKQNGVIDRAKYNQVANYVYLDTQVNISIGKKAPNEYFGLALEQCDTSTREIGTIVKRDDFNTNLAANCIPTSVTNMSVEDYDAFLIERRKLMAAKIKEYYQAI
ncbi:MAG: DUF262 domain-containing protein [Anaeromusa sp.]|uniref:GmrSD restriction endonuclease domain-containing protein n=1 Tax=Anaeromusa sp. TaxID=1872520 RepID=UPI002B1F32D5|nr:DUF262 domain-containing protein [Anaeromusa sp.]MEA4835236.1 DUF262 domain-containing protein [Anaeromusa sp.]